MCTSRIRTTKRHQRCRCNEKGCHRTSIHNTKIAIFKEGVNGFIDLDGILPLTHLQACISYEEVKKIVPLAGSTMATIGAMVCVRICHWKYTATLLARTATEDIYSVCRVWICPSSSGNF